MWNQIQGTHNFHDWKYRFNSSTLKTEDMLLKCNGDFITENIDSMFYCFPKLFLKTVKQITVSRKPFDVCFLKHITVLKTLSINQAHMFLLKIFFWI